MTPPVRPEKDHLAALRENLAYLRDQGASKEEMQAEIARWEHVLPPGVVARQREFASGRLGERMGDQRTGQVGSENVLDRAKMLEGGDMTRAVAQTALEGGTFGLSGVVEDAIRAIGPETYRAGRDARKAIRNEVPASSRILAGVSGGLLNPVNLAVPASMFSGSLLKAAGSGAVIGGASGLSQYVGENVGTSSGVDPLGAGMSAGIGALAGGIFAPIAARIFRPKDHLVGQRLNEPMLADRGAMRDVPFRSDFPEPMALDVVGPETLATLRGTTGTTRGRETLRTALEGREAQMGRALRKGIPDAEVTRNALKADLDAVGKKVYPEAIEATKGVPVTGVALDEFLSTPVGKAAWKTVQSNRPNRVVGTGDPARALPTSPQWKGPDLVDEPVPDAEAIHEMKRLVSDWGSADKDFDFPEGVSAIAAQDALGLFGRIRDLLPEPFQVADAAYEEAAKPLTALELGLKKWKGNVGPKRKAEALTNVETAIAAMSPEARRAATQAKQFDIADQLANKRLGIEKAAGLLADPTSDLARTLKVAGGDLGERIPAWAEAARRKSAVLPEGGTAIVPSRETFFSKLLQSAGPTARVTAVRTGRTVGSEMTEESLEKLGREDESIVNLLTGKPEKLREYLAKYRTADRKRQLTSSLAAGSGGRVGLLFNDK